MKLWLDTFEGVLGKKKNKHKELLSFDTIKRIEKRKEKRAVLNISQTRVAKVKAQEEYIEANREVRRGL
jgi:hypothetical protein